MYHTCSVGHEASINHKVINPKLADSSLILNAVSPKTNSAVLDADILLAFPLSPFA